MSTCSRCLCRQHHGRNVQHVTHTIQGPKAIHLPHSRRCFHPVTRFRPSFRSTFAHHVAEDSVGTLRNIYASVVAPWTTFVTKFPARTESWLTSFSLGVTFTIVRRGAPVVHFTAVPIQSVIRGVYKLTRNPTSAISWPLLAPAGLWWQRSLSIYAGWVVTGGVNPETAGLSLRVFLLYHGRFSSFH